MLVAQVSDIHASPDNDNLQRFDKALAWLDQLKPDVLVLSGDVIDNQWLDGYSQIAERLSSKKWCSRILPGNSDDRRQMRAVWGAAAADEFLHFNYDAGVLRLIGLDSTLVNTTAGSVVNHIAWLEQQLRDIHTSPALLFLHHHVFASGIPSLDKTMCAGTAELAALLRHMPGKVLAIATGHVHRPIAGSLAGVPAYICGSLCPANPVWFGTDTIPPVNDPPALMIHRYVDNVLTSHHVSL
ncbi:metallophosphoesterase [Pantoea phytobeneficialis]|uniref:Metallophosphoesterase n=1 Tax=Pantoea phytobeneficialis TaxID=2052056 RepID=A0AAP9KSD6_9GAMM|nr:metallophosphoesterase [Pantoea phytobeneficialis]MDO6407037.1 metallophosphoesterase [Pantoea phytobeneficialis]QGR10000.1 metallophosphoesterase [Pantoea phytobeneficialis]